MNATTEASRRVRLLGGGTDGNEQLTAIVGVVLTVLLLAIGVTIIRIGQLTWLHLFIGLVLIGPVVVKLGSTGYRFFRYYTRNPEYVRRGPPELYLRLSAPLLVLMTVAVFVTGVVLLFLGPADRGSWVEIHKITFIVWGAMFAIHFLGHLPEMPRMLSASVRRYGAGGTAGDSGRWVTLAGALVVGLVLATVLIPDFHSWTAPGRVSAPPSPLVPSGARSRTTITTSAVGSAFPHHRHHWSRAQRAYSTARDSLITVTLIWPGYSSSFSISRAIS